jgi:hypothetical protein
MIGDGLEDSWDFDTERYTADINVARWENCREQGYVISFCSKDYSRQVNIAFFEHRNSDNICAVRWEQRTTNSPTIDTAVFGAAVYKNKWDVSTSFSYNQMYELAEWIYKELETFWKETNGQ